MMLVLVEGPSDAAAVRAIMDMLHADGSAHAIVVRDAAGVTNFARELQAFVQAHPGVPFCGLYDVADARHVRRALREAGVALHDDEPLQPHGFFACEADLEDELMRALGPAAVEDMLACEGELASFRRFQAMPEHRQSTITAQLHRFLGTRATRKIRAGRLLTQRLSPENLPPPLALLAERLRDVVQG